MVTSELPGSNRSPSDTLDDIEQCPHVRRRAPDHPAIAAAVTGHVRDVDAEHARLLAVRNQDCVRTDGRQSDSASTSDAALEFDA